MTLEERTGIRDLTFSRWHRQDVPSDCSWIDIDCCHYCHYCHSLLGFFELVHSSDDAYLLETCRRKPAAITHRVGARCQVPVFKVAYTGDPLRAAAVQRLGQPEVRVHSPAELASFIDKLHDCEFCRRHRGGRFATTLPTSLQTRIIP